MREDIVNWKHKSGERAWDPFLDLFERGPVSDEDFGHIVENSSDNFERYRKSRYNPVRECLNSIYYKDKFEERDFEIDNSFLNGERINFKGFLSRVEKYPMSEETFDCLINSSNTTGYYNEDEQNIIKVSKKIREIANKLHGQDKYISAEKVSSDLEQQAAKSKNDSQNIKKNIPEQIQRTVVDYNRSQDVIDTTLSRANGVCEKCNKNAPFIKKKDNTPYLEVHHKVMLADGGEDTIKNTIAVCPNCHRELHFGI